MHTASGHMWPSVYGCMYGQQLYWEAGLKLSTRNPGFVSLLPGTLSTVEIESYEYHGSIKTNFILKVYWLENDEKIFERKPIFENMCTDNWFSENYSAIRTTESHYYAYMSPCCLSPDSDSYHRPKSSWKAASGLCKSAGGYLPIIRSRRELNEIIDLFKLKRLQGPLPIIQIMFIGLISSNSSRIR